MGNTELLKQTILNIEELTQRGVIPDTTEGFVALNAILKSLLYSELDREQEIASGEGPDEHDPEEVAL